MRNPVHSQVKKPTVSSRLFSFISVFLLGLGAIIFLVARLRDRYVEYYIKQGLLLTFLVLLLVLIAVIPFGVILTIIGLFITVILWIIGWVYALSGKEKPIPLIGHFADNFKI